MEGGPKFCKLAVDKSVIYPPGFFQITLFQLTVCKSLEEK
jgi:hypothetical protein